MLPIDGWPLTIKLTKTTAVSSCQGLTAVVFVCVITFFIVKSTDKSIDLLSVFSDCNSDYDHLKDKACQCNVLYHHNRTTPLSKSEGSHASLLIQKGQPPTVMVTPCLLRGNFHFTMVSKELQCKIFLFGFSILLVIHVHMVCSYSVHFLFIFRFQYLVPHRCQRR